MTRSRPSDSSAAQERFERDTAEHALSVLRDDGLYRHLRFQKPGTSTYYYDLITWPGYLTIAGDAGHYTFSRTPDMFEFFGGEGQINPGYWSEKLCGPGYDTARHYTHDALRALVLEWLEETSRGMPDDQVADLRSALDLSVLSEHSDAFHDEHEAHRLLRDFEHDGHRIDDSWEWDLRGYDGNFLWCCWAIMRGIARYRALPVDLDEALLCR